VSRRTPIGADLQRVLAHRAGSPLVWRRVPSTSSEVWRVSGPNACLALKWPRPGRALAQERAALAAVGPAGCGPTLLECVDGVLVCTWLAGAPRREWDAPSLSAAGACLGTLHRIPIVDDDPTPLGRAITIRVRTLLAQAEEHGVRGVGALAAATVGVEALPMPRVWTHRDARLQNWLFDPGHGALVDFEHSRPDCALLDIAAVWLDGGLDSAASRDAFAQAYGAAPWRDTAWRSVTGLVALGTLCWGLRHADAAFIRRGELDWSRWVREPDRSH
jgi:aminoglycoside phosphotransferase (APT) family kinase protein